MNYRTLGRTGIKVSQIGLGGEGLEGIPYERCEALVDYAMKKGINFIDIFNSNPEVRINVGKSLSKYSRESFVIEGHLGAAWEDGQYFRTRDLAKVKGAYEDFFKQMQLDYIDVGMIHYVDEPVDFDAVCQNGMLDYAKELHSKGKIKSIGLSTHNPVIAEKAVEEGSFDVILFSINPAYDMLPADEDVNTLFEEKTYDRVYQGITPQRERLYQICHKEGVALTVMKGFAGGTLLNVEESPFGKAMSPAQCIAYCLDRPAVASVIGGFSEEWQIDQAVHHETATREELDYSTILANAPRKSFIGHCMYCGHCAPCPNRIDVAAVNKYLDLAQIQQTLPDTVKDHYLLLEHHGSECIACGSCMENCPFGVDVISKMKEAANIFGK